MSRHTFADFLNKIRCLLGMMVLEIIMLGFTLRDSILQKCSSCQRLMTVGKCVAMTEISNSSARWSLWDSPIDLISWFQILLTAAFINRAKILASYIPSKVAPLSVFRHRVENMFVLTWELQLISKYTFHEQTVDQTWKCDGRVS